jgi:sarcosine/dimethylglycine N-methyltransferase
VTTARELYELWASGSGLDPRLDASLDPRGKDWLFELFATLGPEAGQVVVDVGARDGRHLRRLVEEHGLQGIGLDPVPQSPEIVEAEMESMPLEDASADWIWARDVLVHVDADRGFAECVRVLRPGGRMVAYVTLATDLLEPRESAWLKEAVALTTLDGSVIERAAGAAGLELEQRVVIGGEWRERMIEDGEWDANDALLRISRMRRLGIDSPPNAADLMWGVYQLLGKLEPTIFVWRRR